MGLVHYSSCPVCSSVNLKDVFTVKDFTVSEMDFLIVECKDCMLRFTQDVPDMGSIGAHYKSENYISHTDTSKGLINSLYKKVRNITLKQKRKLIESITNKKAGRLLDIGSGTGAFANEMKTNGWDVTGLEPDRGAIKIAKELYGLELEETNKLFELPSESYDAITLWHVLEHVHSLQEYIAQLKKLLTEKGRLIIAVPNYTCYDEKVYKQYWAAYDVPRHLYHFSPQAMESLMNRHRLKIIDYKPMWYDSFYVSLLSSKYENGSASWIGAGWNGLISDIKALGHVKKCSSVIYIISG
ncbi:MAG: class I SAM-dependent methyltransferase [Bacteroidetes bacterium]|nr:class I SAM-dependent methyltransferase [Bacteroidota bacterium]